MQVLLPGRTAWRKSGSQTGCLGAGKGTGIRTGCLGAGKGIIIRRDVPGADVPKSATAPRIPGAATANFAARRAGAERWKYGVQIYGGQF